MTKAERAYNKAYRDFKKARAVVSGIRALLANPQASVSLKRHLESHLTYAEVKEEEARREAQRAGNLVDLEQADPPPGVGV